VTKPEGRLTNPARNVSQIVAHTCASSTDTYFLVWNHKYANHRQTLFDEIEKFFTSYAEVSGGIPAK
jgi:hypothetical protein